MDITQQKETYENFKVFSLWGTIIVVAIVALMAIFLT